MGDTTPQPITEEQKFDTHSLATKRITLIAGAVFVAAIFGIGGYFLSQNSEIQKGADQIPPRLQETVEVVDTSTWNTYRNEEYGFEFRYREYDDIKVSEYKDSMEAIVFSPRYFNPASETSAAASVSVDLNPDNLSFENYYFNEYPNKLRVISIGIKSWIDITVDGRKAMQLGENPPIYIIVPVAGAFIKISNEGGHSYDEKFIQPILSTFKFIR